MYRFLFVLTIIILFTVPAYCGSLYFLGSYLTPDGRSDIFEQNTHDTTFDTDDFDNITGTVGYDGFIGEHVTMGVSVTYYRADTTGEDRAFPLPGGGFVRRDFRLKIIPMEFNVSALPMGRSSFIVPFIGGGVGYYRWEYEESGLFVINRDSDPRIISARASSDGYEFGYHIYGGLHIPISSAVVITGQVKHFNVEADLEDPLFARFEPIDLSAYVYSFGLSFWFR